MTAQLPAGQSHLALRVKAILLGREMRPHYDVTVILDEGILTELTVHHVIGEIDLGQALFLPGLVNAHTHLEFSQLNEPLPRPLPFTGWIRDLIAYRRSSAGELHPREPGLIPAAHSLGWSESRQQGITHVGDIISQASRRRTGDRDAIDESLLNAPLSTTLFYEVIGFGPERAAEQLNFASRELEFHAQQSGSTLSNTRLGLSPHAPYTVGLHLAEGLARLARLHRVPLAMHLSETLAELQFLHDQTGEFRDMLELLGVYTPGVIPPRTSVRDYLELFGDLPRVLIIHGNYLTDEELHWLSRRPHEGALMSVVYCPRTHAYFQHHPHRFRDMLAQGINVCLGTDSRGSNPDLSIWKEVLFLHERHPEMSFRDLWSLASWRSSQALGIPGEQGLILGQLARYTILNLPPDADPMQEASWWKAEPAGSPS